MTLLLVLFVTAGCSKDSGSKAAFCERVAAVPALDGVLSGFDRVDPDELTRRLSSTRRAYHELERSAPGSIHQDTVELVGLVDDVLDAVRDHPRDPEAVASTLRGRMAAHPDASAAAKAVSAYAKNRCHVQLDPATAGPR